MSNYRRRECLLSCACLSIPLPGARASVYRLHCLSRDSLVRENGVQTKYCKGSGSMGELDSWRHGGAGGLYQKNGVKLPYGGSEGLGGSSF